MIWLCLGFVFLLILRIPVAFALFLSTTVYSIVTGLLPVTSITSIAISGVDSYLLVAIPAYILMAELMNQSTITNRIFDFASALVGHLPGGLSHVNIVGSLIFAGMSGSSSADIAGLGRIEVRMMEEEGYPRPFASAVTVASATLGPVLPPSIIMVVMAAAMQESIGRMFLGGVIPAFIMAAFFMITVYVICRKHKEWGRQVAMSWTHRWQCLLRAFPALLTPAILLAGTLSGYWTPTEAGAAACIYAFFLSKVIYHEMRWKDIFGALRRSAQSTGNILIIFAAAHILSRMVALEGTPVTIVSFLQSLTDNPYWVLVLLNVFFFIGGMFIEPTPLVLIVAPILVKIAAAYSLSLIHLGVVAVVNLMLGTITPPFAIGLFVISEAVNVPFHKLVKATLPFYVPFVAVLIVITFLPATILWLPDLLLAG